VGGDWEREDVKEEVGNKGELLREGKDRGVV